MELDGQHASSVELLTRLSKVELVNHTPYSVSDFPRRARYLTTQNLRRNRRHQLNKMLMRNGTSCETRNLPPIYNIHAQLNPIQLSPTSLMDFPCLRPDWIALQTYSKTIHVARWTDPIVGLADLLIYVHIRQRNKSKSRMHRLARTVCAGLRW